MKVNENAIAVKKQILDYNKFTQKLSGTVEERKLLVNEALSEQF